VAICCQLDSWAGMSTFSLLSFFKFPMLVLLNIRKYFRVLSFQLAFFSLAWMLEESVGEFRTGYGCKASDEGLGSLLVVR
jgi:hypothetical protein